MTAYYRSPDVHVFGPHRRVKTGSYDSVYELYEPYWDEYLDYLLYRDRCLENHWKIKQLFFVVVDDEEMPSAYA